MLHGELELVPDPEQLGNARSSLDPVIVAKLAKSAVLRLELTILPRLSLPLRLLLFLFPVVSWEESSEVTKVPVAESRKLIVMESKLSVCMER